MQPAFGSAFGSAFGAGVDPTFAAAAAGGFSSILDELSGELAPYVTFTRASTGARFNSAGLMEHSVPANVPRYDFDPTTVTRANLLRYSEDLTQSVWGKYNLTVSGVSGPGPFSGAAVFKLGETTATADHSIIQTLAGSTVAGASVFSFYAKPAERGFLRLSSNNEYIDASVDLSTGQTGGSGAANVSVELLSDGWVRISLTYNANGAGSGTVYIYPKQSLAGGTNYTGTEGAGIFVSSPQVERGSTATAYIPTGILQRGPNVVVDDDFDDPVYWTTAGAATVSGGKANLVGTSQVYRNGSALVAGRAYEAEILVSSITGGVVAVRTNSTTRGTTSVAGVFRVPFVATVTGERIEVSGNASAAASVDYLRIREINYDYNSPRGDATLRGLLVEEQRTNLLLRSQELDNVAWILSEATVSANAGAAPDGSTTADKLIPSAVSSNQHFARQSVTSSVGTTYISSFFVKAAGYASVALRHVGSNAGIAQFDLLAQTCDNPNGTIKSVGGGWYRVTLAGVADATLLNSYIYPNRQSTFAGDGTSGILVWGAQLEAGTFATSYIPTTATARTRSADTAIVSALSSIGFNANEGTLLAEYSPSFTSSSGNAGAAALFDAAGSASWAYVGTLSSSGDGTMSVRRASADALSTSASGSSVASGLMRKTAVAYSSSTSCIGASKGVLSGVGIAMSGPLSGVTELRIGRFAANPGYTNGHIFRIRYYPRRLSSAQLQALTA